MSSFPQYGKTARPPKIVNHIDVCRANCGRLQMFQALNRVHFWFDRPDSDVDWDFIRGLDIQAIRGTDNPRGLPGVEDLQGVIDFKRKTPEEKWEIERYTTAEMHEYISNWSNGQMMRAT